MKLFIMVFISWTFIFSQKTFSSPILKGSPESQQRQNQEADRSGLSRVTNTVELDMLKKHGLLIKIPETPGIKIDPRLNEQFHVVRPWTAEFLSDLGKKFKKRFKSDLQVNSATRTIVYQEDLAKHNKNAAPVTGDTRSAHLTGAAIDIAKIPLTHKQKQWLRKELEELENENLIEATEEHFQAVFHIMVFMNYANSNTRLALK